MGRARKPTPMAKIRKPPARKRAQTLKVSAQLDSVSPARKPPYTGASDKLTISQWFTSFMTADGALLPSLPRLRDRSRDLELNAPAARGAIKTMNLGMLGSGLRMKSSIDRDILGVDEEQAVEIEHNIENEFRLLTETPEVDFMRQLKFLGLQQLALRSQHSSGDVYALLPWVPREGVPYDLKVNLIEADRVCNPRDLPDSDQISGGVERDKDGVPVAIHIRTPHPGASNFAQVTPTWERVPILGEQTKRRNVLHLMDVDRIGQTRGAPLLSPVIETVKQVSRYSEAELASAVVNALLSVFIERHPEDHASGVVYQYPPGEEPWLRSDNFKLGTGTWIDGAPGEKMNIVNAARPSNQYDPFFSACMKQIGMALGIPFEVLMKLYQSSFSASRAAILEAEKLFDALRDYFIDSFCQPFHEAFLFEAAIKGRLNLPGFLTDPMLRMAYCGAYWHAPTQGQIDEMKAVQAANLRVQYGFSTRTKEALRISGMDFKDIAREQAEEKKLSEKYGMVFGREFAAGNMFEDNQDTSQQEAA